MQYPERLAVCIDTAHLFAAGHDIRTPKGWDKTVKQMDSLFGRKQIAAFHLNDSKTELNSRVDRHEHIGKGKIGLEAFRHIVNDARFKNSPAAWKPSNPRTCTRTSKTWRRCDRWSKSLRELSSGQRDEILQQLQADRLAFFRVKLRGIHIVAPDRRGEDLAVSGLRRGNGRVRRFGKKTVDEINVTAGGIPRKSGQSGRTMSKLVPANLRNLDAGLVRKADDACREKLPSPPRNC